MSFEDFLRSKLEENDDSDDFKSPDAAKKALQEFLDYKPEFKVGDYVERSKFGEKVVKYPKQNQVAQVLRVYDDIRIDKDGDIYDITLVVALEVGVFKAFNVWSKYYKPAKQTKNVFNFRK